MNLARLLERLSRGGVDNVAFPDLVRLAEAFGFERRRTSGSHHIYGHPRLVERVNLQDFRGQAKPYQVRQVIRLIERYDLTMESET